MRTEDGYLIYQCLNGDTEAFGFLVDKYKAGVYALIYARVRDFHHAEDVSQEVSISDKKSCSSRYAHFSDRTYCQAFIHIAHQSLTLMESTNSS